MSFGFAGDEDAVFGGESKVVNLVTKFCRERAVDEMSNLYLPIDPFQKVTHRNGKIFCFGNGLEDFLVFAFFGFGS